jgi:lauroyl/myristoyl acyltransferase
MSNDQPIVTWSDIGISLILPFLLLISWSQPPRIWQFVSTRISRGLSAILPRRTEREISFLRCLFEGSGRSDRLDEIQLRLQSDKILQLFEYLREMRPGGWSPNISLTGTEHIDQALRKGVGVVLWVVLARSSGLIAKRSLKEAGYSIGHLSRSTHGMSRSYYGRMVLNKIIVNSETKHLSRRLLVDEPENMRSMRLTKELLKSGGILSVSMSGFGKQRVTVKVLGIRVGLATGAPNLALRTGAVLLPVVTRPGEAGVFEVKVEPPIEPPAASNRSDAICHMAAQFARILERELQINPASGMCSLLRIRTIEEQRSKDQIASRQESRLSRE